MNEPIAGALAKLTAEGSKALAEGGKVLAEGGKVLAESSKALMALPQRGRALVKRVPEPVQIELAKLSSRGAHVCREIFAGIFVVGLVIIVAGYGRLSRGPVSVPGLVPPIEAAINDQLTGLKVKIDDAFFTRSPDGPGVLFRLRNIRLIDEDGSIVAQAPLAAIGMSGSALLSGHLAPGSVDFIGPRLLLFYNEDQGLSLSFSRPSSAESEALIRGSLPAEDNGDAEPGLVPPETVVTKRPDVPVGASGRKFDLNKTVSEVFDRARQGDTSYLTRFGFKDALVVLSRDGTQTMWQVPDFAIDLDHHNRRSVLVGQANIASSKGDWQLELRTEQRTRDRSLRMTALIEDLVPSGIASNFPSIGLLRALDMAVDGEADVDLSKNGDFIAGDAKLALAPGQIVAPWDPDTPMRIDGGHLQVRYDKNKNLIELAPSTLVWGKSKATFSGTFRPIRGADGEPVSWDFALKADDAVLAVEEAGLGPMKVDEWSAKGNIAVKQGKLTLSSFIIRAGDASIALAGAVADAGGSPEVHLTGTVSPMPVDTLKLLWPKFMAGKARAWVLERIAGGAVKGGKFSVNLGPGVLAAIEKGGEAPDGAVDVALGLSGLAIAYIPKMPPIVTGDATLRVKGTEFSIDIPQAKIAVADGQEIALSNGRFVIPDLRVDPQRGVITYHAAAATPTVLALLDHEPLGYMRDVGLKPDFLGGSAEGDFTLSMPLRADLDFKEIAMGGKARLNDAIASSLMGDVPVTAETIDVNLTERGIQARGPIHIKGVPAEIDWQRIFYAPDEEQPPTKITTTLDEAGRQKLGIELNHLIKGKTPVTLSIAGLGRAAPALNMQADLTQAQLLFGSMGWTKPAGRAATATFDVARKEGGAIDLENLKILGDDIDVQGSISLDPEQRLKGFYFSDFSVNRLSHVQIVATMREDRVLDIKAEGPSYDGRQFFQSLFSPSQIAGSGSSASQNDFGIDFSAAIGTIVGFYDTTARDVQVTVKKRNGRLVALDAKGNLNGKTPATVRLDEGEGARLILAESGDAGSAFRLVGFYPSVEGGVALLRVNLDAGAGDAISGTLKAQDFTVAGDTVVNDVLTDPGAAAVLGDRKPQGTRIAFNRLRAPFTVGSGKFRLNDAYINGPALGATMRGQVDFKARTVDLGGTYVPLYGLNSALGAIPILGKVFVGRKGEGVVGITFAIKGKLENPAVLVNPMSVMTPGIFRQLFEFSSDGTDAAAATPPNNDFTPQQ
jgi:hypothetical protein